MTLHVPTKAHERIINAVTREGPVSVKLILTGTPQYRIYATSGQKTKNILKLKLNGCCK